MAVDKKTEDFINKATVIHKSKYSYNKTIYLKGKEKVCITCPAHGDFFQTPHNHLKGEGCPLCAKNKKLTTPDFIQRATSVHNGKYDYSLVVYNTNNTKVPIICHEQDEYGKEHGVFYQTPSSHLRGNGCPLCDKSHKHTLEWFIKKATEKHNGKYIYDKVEYVNNSTNVCIICPTHGEFWQHPRHHVNGCGCPSCKGGVKSSTEEFIRKAKEKHGDEYDYSQVEYVNAITPVAISCPTHGIFYQTPNAHLAGRRCPQCYGTFRKTTEEFIAEAKKVHGDKYSYENTVYINAKTKVTVTCPVHGDFLVDPYSHIRSGCGCHRCAMEKFSRDRLKTTEEFIVEAQATHKGKYDYSNTVYINSKTKVAINCPKHGVFYQLPSLHARGVGCPRCAVEISQAEEDIANFLTSYGLQIERGNRSILEGREIDILIPQHNVGIEYNGLIWHSDRFNKTKTYHVEKTEGCLERGIRLVQIFEDEWLHKKEIVLSQLRSILNIDDVERIEASNCEARPIGYKEGETFLKDNHIGGSSAANCYYGLYMSGRLLSVMSFQTEKQNKRAWKIRRFCDAINTAVVGGAEKILAYFINEQQPLSIAVYIDRRWDNGALYEELGFTHVCNTPPKYSFVVQYSRESYSKYKKHKDKNKRKPFRIYDCGDMVFRMDFCE